MIKTEELNNGVLIRHYSDSNYMLLQTETGLLYADVIDINPCPYTYSETNIIAASEPIVEEKAEAYDILMGEEI